MSYQSPIDVIMGQMNISYENEICKAVQNVNICVEREELIKALRYDREQYEKGYADRDSEIVRCKDCRFGVKRLDALRNECIECHKYTSWHTHNLEHFCADGKLKEGVHDD